MASDGNPVKIPAASLVHGSQAQIPVSIQERSGKALPPGGKRTSEPAAHAPPKASDSSSLARSVGISGGLLDSHA
jgi:hypothetical protein